jgi:extracellular factor (EF) 3-hydroxypalmitic acid methyl ester biosynthesis protein
MLEVALDGVLSDTAQLFLEQPSVQVIDDLTRNLAELHDRAVDLGILPAFKNVCGNHPISRIIRQDPYVRRAFEKPRGYAGDAVMLDYIYRPESIDASTAVRIIHEATTGLPNAKSILWRRDYLAAHILDVIETRKAGRILSVASGHMRELDEVRRRTSRRDVEIWALDQDRESLLEALQAAGDFDLKPLNCSILALFKSNSVLTEKFDLIYSAGLADYLSDKTLTALIHQLHRHLNPGGIFTVGNFTPDSHGRGFMEGFMDWSLIYRDESSLASIVNEAVPGASFKTFRDPYGNVAYIEVVKPH